MTHGVAFDVTANAFTRAAIQNGNFEAGSPGLRRRALRASSQ